MSRKLLAALAMVAVSVAGPGLAGAHAVARPSVDRTLAHVHPMSTRSQVQDTKAGVNEPCFLTLSAGCAPIPLTYGVPVRQGLGGPVMQAGTTTYLIYWEPSGSTVSGTYHTLVDRFFDDVGGSSLYGTATQYYQTTGGGTAQCTGVVVTTICQHIVNSSLRGASWIDTGAYPASYSTSGYLSDADIQGEITHAIATKGWTANINTAFFVFLPHGVTQCMDASTCSFSNYCAYHSYFTSGSSTVIYASMPYVDTNRAACGYQSADFGLLTSTPSGPNGDIAADEEISTASHELMEAVTDPKLNAWYDATGYENGDKCAYTYGPIEPNGSRPVSNLTHNGHSYLVQLEWDNASAGCAG